MTRWLGSGTGLSGSGIPNEVDAWIRARVADDGSGVSGEITVVRERPWSLVLRVPTDQGSLYFKASAPAMRHEPEVTAFLSRLRPDVVPPPLAIDADRGWMLLPDAGAPLREGIERTGHVTPWLDVLPKYGQLQLQVAARTGELIALGVPDMRLAGLPARFEALLDRLEPTLQEDRSGERSAASLRLRAAIPWVRSAAIELARLGIPDSIQHDDLNDGAAYLVGGQCRILDWGDACVSHPFFTMSVTLEGVIAWGAEDVEGSIDVTPYREAYLTAYADVDRGERLERSFNAALRLGWICRAVNGYGLEPEPDPAWRRLGMFLGGFGQGAP